MPIYLPTFIIIIIIIIIIIFFFYVFAIELTKCKSQNKKEIISCKSLSHILVFD